MYLDALAWLEASGLGVAVRGAGRAYAVVNTLHVLGAAMVVGGIAVFDLLVLSRRGPDAVASGRVAIPLAAAGLTMQVATGLVLFSADARALGVNPAFLAKLGFMALGLVNLAILHARFGAGWAGGFPADEARPYAAVSLAAWVLTLAAGRMIAYV